MLRADDEEVPAGFLDDEDSEDGDDVFGKQIAPNAVPPSARTESEDGGDEMYRVEEGEGGGGGGKEAEVAGLF